MPDAQPAPVGGPLPRDPSLDGQVEEKGRAACRPWASTPRPTTAGSTSWTATDPRSCGPGRGAHPGWRIRPACWSSSGWSPSPSATRGSGQPGSPPSSPNPAGAPSSCRPTGLAGAVPPRPEHPGQALRAGRRLRRPTRAPTTTAAARAPPGHRPPSPAGPAGLFLHRPPQRDQGHRVAVHRHRHRLRLHLGHPPGHSPQPLSPLDQHPGPARWPPTWPAAAGSSSGS
jgi:hypothetical protein